MSSLCAIQSQLNFSEIGATPLWQSVCSGFPKQPPASRGKENPREHQRGTAASWPREPFSQKNHGDGRRYPPPNRTFRWSRACGMKIDPVNLFVKQRLGHRGEAILHLGAHCGRGTRDGVEL
jgi:hypothetical protein